jgi:hypothetical protein
LGALLRLILLRSSLPRFADSGFPGNCLWDWELPPASKALPESNPPRSAPLRRPAPRVLHAVDPVGVRQPREAAVPHPEERVRGPMARLVPVAPGLSWGPAAGKGKHAHIARSSGKSAAATTTACFATAAENPRFKNHTLQCGRFAVLKLCSSLDTSALLADLQSRNDLK